MHRSAPSTTATLILALASGLVACAAGAAEEPRQATAGGRDAASACPKPEAIESAIGLPVMARTMTREICLYELTGRHRGVFATLMYQPATRADDLFADLRKRVKVKGAAAQPDRLTVGEGGWGYTSRGRNEAAVVAGGQLYHVDISDSQLGSLTVREDAAVRVIELAMSEAPSSPSGGARPAAATLDACTLASNAEVSEIAEERPDIAKYWSAPTAAFGGSHCTYDGGSIQVYQGKAPEAALEATLKATKAEKEPRTPVVGIGDKAFFMIPKPDDKYNRFGLLAVYAGPRVLQLTLDAQGDEPIEATRPRLERLARLVLPRLR